MLKISKADVYYTLWKSTRYEAIFVKNISKDLDKAKSLYPDAEIDFSLRGKFVSFRGSGSSTGEERQPQSIEEFHFGKYAGKPIFECEDESYINWYMDNTSVSQRVWIANRISERTGKEVWDEQKIHEYKYPESMIGFFVTNSDRINMNMIDTLKNGLPLTVHIGKLGGDVVRISREIVLQFQEDDVKVTCSYYGTNAYIRIGNKYKRVKDQDIEILKYEVKEYNEEFWITPLEYRLK